jgi:hypothetical protein
VFLPASRAAQERQIVQACPPETIRVDLDFTCPSTMSSCLPIYPKYFGSIAFRPIKCSQSVDRPFVSLFYCVDKSVARRDVALFYFIFIFSCFNSFLFFPLANPSVGEG